MRASLARRAFGVSLCALAACGREPRTPADSTGGTLLIATGSDADAVLPPLVKTSVGKEASDALFLPIAHPGDDLNLLGDAGYTPGLAERWEWAPDSLSITFHLDPRARWHDGQPVRATDVRYTLAAYRAPAVAAIGLPNLVALDSITVRDSLAFVAWYARRSPTQFYDLVTTLTPIPEHVYGAVPMDSLPTSPRARVPVGSGKFRLARWLPNERLELVADTTHWLGRPRLDRVAWLAVPDPVAQVAMLVAGEADMVEFLRGAALETAGKDTSVRIVSSPSFAYAMAVFNLRDPAVPTRPHPLFGDRELRRALSMAVDRPSLVANVLDTLGLSLTSPFVSSHGIPGADLLPFDTVRATALLDSLGWRDTDGDGVRQKSNRDLAFTVAAPSSSAPRQRAAEILEQAFKRVGARVTLEKPENPVLMTNAAAGRFDISILGFSGDPNPASLRQYWKTERKDEGSNYGGYANRTFDVLIDSAAGSLDPSAARILFRRAGEVLAADAPAIWVYEARTVSGIHSRFRVAPMRADAWWAHLDRWSVDPAHRKDRDRIGPGAAPK